jgi:hypothetical protein
MLIPYIVVSKNMVTMICGALSGLKSLVFRAFAARLEGVPFKSLFVKHALQISRFGL